MNFSDRLSGLQRLISCLDCHAVIIAFCLVANRVVKHASEVREHSEIRNGCEMFNNMIGGVMGKFSPKFRNYIEPYLSLSF